MPCRLPAQSHAGRSARREHGAADPSAQYCKNCLLVELGCLFPPHFVCAYQWENNITDGGDLDWFINYEKGVMANLSNEGKRVVTIRVTDR